MKVQIDRVTTTTETVELPERCPGCGADFRDDDTLGELQLDHGVQACWIDDANGGLAFDDVEHFGHQIVTGYECRRCQRTLVGRGDAEPERCPTCGLPSTYPCACAAPCDCRGQHADGCSHDPDPAKCCAKCGDAIAEPELVGPERCARCADPAPVTCATCGLAGDVAAQTFVEVCEGCNRALPAEAGATGACPRGCDAGTVTYDRVTVCVCGTAQL